MIDNSIPNIRVYTEGMRKSLLDKLWFLDKMPNTIKTIYDYGCADGSLLEMVDDICPGAFQLLGYDCNREMVDLANQKIPHTNPNNIISQIPLQLGPNALLNASSVFHEIHAYSLSVQNEYENIFDCNAESIAIRDMFYSENSCKPTDKTMLASVYQKESDYKIREFEAFNGRITENRNFLHYLLKYRYLENWEREVRENYFPHSIEQFLAKIPKHYQIVYFEHYTLPFLQERIKHDFGFTLRDPTHAKILLMKKP